MADARVHDDGIWPALAQQLATAVLEVLEVLQV